MQDPEIHHDTLEYLTARMQKIKDSVGLDEHSHGATGAKLWGEWPYNQVSLHLQYDVLTPYHSGEARGARPSLGEYAGSYSVGWRPRPHTCELSHTTCQHADPIFILTLMVVSIHTSSVGALETGTPMAILLPSETPVLHLAQR